MADDLQDPTQPPVGATPDTPEVAQPTDAVAPQAPAEVPAQPPQPVAPQSPLGIPTWGQVEESEAYQNATPEHRLVAFSRWHDAAYNIAKEQPNWDEIKDQFNQKAFDTQNQLTADAGGLTPETARLKMANDLASQAETPEAKKALVAQLGDDVLRDWEKPPTLGQQVMRPLTSFGNAFAKGLGETMKAAGYVGETGWEALTGEHGHSWIGQLGDLMDKRAEQLDSVLDPRTKGSVADVVGSATGGLLEFLGESALGGEAFKGLAAARVAQQGLKGVEAVNAVKQLAGKLGAMAVFGTHNAEQGMEQARREGADQGTVLKTFLADFAVGAGTAAITPAGKWLTRLEEKGLALKPMIQKAVLEGGQFAGQMLAQQLGNNVTAKTILGSDDSLLKDTFDQAKSGGVTGVVASLVLSALAHGAKPGGIPANVREAAAKVGPETERALSEQVGAQPTAGAEAAPEPAKIVVTKGEPNLQVAPEATAEHLEDLRQTVKASTLSDEQKLRLDEQISAAIKSRGAEAAPPAEAPPAEAAPPAEPTAPAEAAPAEGAAPVPEETAATVNIKPGVVTPEEEARIAKVQEATAKAAEKGEAPTVGAVARAAAVREPEEAKAARRAEGTKSIQEITNREGVVLSRSEIAQAIGGPPNSAEVTRLHNESKAAVEAKYPPETLPEGAKETAPIDFETSYRASREGIDTERKALNQKLEDLRNKRGKEISLDDYQTGKEAVMSDLAELKKRERSLTEASVSPDVHPVTREHLPTVTEADGTVRPKFTNDPNVTAKQLDAGQFDTSAKRMYLPDELVDSDKINPNIHFAYDKAAGKYYVTAVDAVLPFHDESGRTHSVYARVKEMGDYTNQYKATRVGEEAQQEISVGGMDALDYLANENKQLRARGDEPLDLDNMVGDGSVEKGDLGFPALEREETGLSPEAERLLAKKEAAKNMPILKALGALDPKNQGDIIGTMLKGIAEGKAGVGKGEAELAKLLLRSGLDTAKIPFKIDPSIPYAGSIRHFTGTQMIEQGVPFSPSMHLNPESAHRSGIVGTFLHEAYHLATIPKLRPDYKYALNKAEQTAVRSLYKIHDYATKQILERILGRTPARVEVDHFRDVMRDLNLLDREGVTKNPVDAALMRPENADILRHGYAYTNPVEFAAEAFSNPNVIAQLEAMKPYPKMPHPAGEGVQKNLFQYVKDWMKQLFLKREIARDINEKSIAWQALEHVQNLAREAPDFTRVGKATLAEQAGLRPPAKFPEEVEAQRLATPEEAAKAEQGLRVAEDKARQDLSYKLARGEQPTAEDYRAAGYHQLAAEQGKRLPFDEAAATIPERRGAKSEEAVDLGTTPEAIQNDGWLAPNGKFIPNLEGRAHDETILRHLQKENPQLFKEVGGKVDKKGNVSISVDGLDTLHQRAMDAGYLRVVGAREGADVHFEGNPSPSQRRLMTDAALMQRSGLVQDLGGRRTRTLAESTGSTVPPPEPGEEKVHVEQTLGLKGRITHDVKWDPDATRGDLLSFSERLDTDPNIPDVDKRRMKQQIAETLGPTVTERMGKDMSVAGYDSANNIANSDARRARNDIIKLSGFGDPAKLTREQRMDLDSMPFVVEAGDSKDKLIADMVKVRDSKKLSDDDKATWLPVMQRALDKYDELNGKKDVYQRLMKEQLQRERANGVQTGNVDNYVTHLLERAENKNFWANLVGDESKGTGGSRYFIKGRYFADFADALANGYIPKSDAEPLIGKLKSGDEGFASNLADLAQRRVEVGQRLVRQKAFEDSLRATKLPDGRTIVAPMEEYENFAGKGGYQRLPKDYAMVSTGVKPLVVAKEFAPLFNALYGRSALDGSNLARFLKMGTGFLKRNTLMFDSYHVGRIMFKELAFGKGSNRVGYNRGLSLLEYSPETMDAMLKDGDINQAQHDYYTKNAPTAKLLLDHGLNAGKVSDNLVAQHATSLPVLKNFNPWVFQKLSRGAMMQVSLDNFKRNMDRFPERGVEGNARQTAKEMNEVFGNLQNQSIFKNKTFQDLNRVVALAPQWAESQLAAELRGYGQLAKAPLDLLKGKARLGTVAQGNLNIVLGMLAAGQVMNYLSTGHSTFENKGDHKLDAYIPNIEGGKQGFWFNPLEISGEYAMMAQRYFAQHMTPMDVVARIAGNKLGPAGRSVSELFTGRDYAGRKFESTQDRIRAAVSDVIPTPIGLSSVVERDPRQAIGFRLTRTPGQREKTVLQSVGLKVAPEMSPRSEVFALAYPFREDKSYSDRASEYREMRRALDNDDLSSAEKEVRLLVDRGHTRDQILAGAGISKTGAIEKERFTGGTTSREREFVRSLTPEQKEIYDQAQRDHVENAKKLRTLMTTLRPELREKFIANERAHQGRSPAE